MRIETLPENPATWRGPDTALTVEVGASYRYKSNPGLILKVTGASRADNYVRLGNEWGWSWKSDSQTFIEQWELMP